MRVVLDTNILISGLMSPGGVASRIADAWFGHAFELLSHPFQIEELRGVTRRSHIRPRIRSSDAGRLVNEIAESAVLITPLPHVRRSPDPHDDFLLAIAEAGNADWLVTGDKSDLLGLRKHLSTPIITARAFLDILDRS